MPEASKLPEGLVLPENLSDEEYITAFLKEFGGTIGKTVFWTDVIGEIMPINAELFKDRYHNTWKANKAERGKYMRLLALGIIEPDEIWLDWVKDRRTGKYAYKKRYIKVWQEKNGSHAFSVFDLQKDGWRGTTSFPAQLEKDIKEREEYINRFRKGFRLYVKGMK